MYPASPAIQADTIRVHHQRLATARYPDSSTLNLSSCRGGRALSWTAERSDRAAYHRAGRGPVTPVDNGFASADRLGEDQ